MKKNLLLIFITLFTNTGRLSSQIYSFEDGAVPAGWTTNSIVANPLQATTTKFKLGAKSLCWKWSAGSLLTVSNPTGLNAASITKYGGIYVWIYNSAYSSGSLKIAFLNSSNAEKCHLDYKLNFKGWRLLNANFKEDMQHDVSALTQMVIHTPATGNGQLYFDDLEFQTSIKWDRETNAQYTVLQNLRAFDYWGARVNGNFGTVPQPTAQQVSYADTITNRLEGWFLSTGKYATATEMVGRKNAIQGQIGTYITRGNAGDFNLTVNADTSVVGGGLYPCYAPSTIDGVTIRDFGDVIAGSMLPLVWDYKLNNTALSKTRWFNMLDWIHDQGWDDGSALGGLYDDRLRSANYYNSLFLMRKELDSARLKRELNTLNWYCLWGNVNVISALPGENSDQIRVMSVGKLTYALLQPDPAKKVAALTNLTRYFNNAFGIAPGFTDTFKPDFSGYHHDGVYNTEYYPDALYTAAWVYYLLHGTPYALSDQVYSTIKNCLLTFRLTASTYDLPASTCGRFPTQTQYLDDILPAFAYLALSKSTPDAELLAAFSRLWKPAVSPMKDVINNASNRICYKTTLGEIKLCLQAAACGVAAEAAPKAAFYLPYSGLMVNRGTKRHVTIKGFSKYIWDFESKGSTDNPYGQYLSYGQLEYTDLVANRKNNNYTSADWEWSRIPGTTTQYLSKSQLYTNSATLRNFSDNTFLGGLSVNDSTSMFSMQLHDNALDKTFYANKSVFCFGNVLVCLGSNISNSSTAQRTETTLFQQEVNPGESIMVNGLTISAGQTNVVQPVVQDNLGNRFIVKTGKVDIVKTNLIYTAVINHGYAPSNQSYTYCMLLQGSDIQEAKYSNPATCPVSVVRQDNVAHIVKNADDNVWGYAIFNSNTLLNDTWINQVNIPSLVMLKKNSLTSYNLVISDPDMHRSSAANVDAFTDLVTEKTPSASFNYEITLNGLFALDGANPGITLTNNGSTTKLALTVIDGKSYSIGLKSVSTGVDSLESNNSFQILGSGTANNYIITSKDNKNVNVFLNSIDGKILKSLMDVPTPCSLDVNGLKYGCYIISVKNQNGILSQKILIK